jgi:Domain of unknown function (DUF4153)
MLLRFMMLWAGATQGLVFWWLWHTQKLDQWPFTQPITFTAILYAAFAVPLVIYLTQGIERLPASIRRVAVVAYLVLFAALGAYAAWATGTVGRGASVDLASAFAAVVLGFVSLGLLCGFDFDARRWDYPRLFNYTWRNGILLATAGVMTGVVWLVLFAGAGLMALIGVKVIMDLIRQPAFIFPVTSLVFAAAFSLGLTRAAMTESIRRFWLSISSWLLPLVLFFGVLWALVIPFTGLGPLFDTRRAAFIMLWFAALAVKFSNCAYQDGEIPQPYPSWLSRTTQAAWLSLLPVVAIAWWALGLRVAQHGLSEQRLWAGLVATLAAIYAVGYALSWLKTERWMAGMARTNIVAAIVLCLGLLAFLTPVADIQRLAVSFHLQHVAAANGAIDADWNYLRWRSGRFGREALKSMADGGGTATDAKLQKQAAMVLSESSPIGNIPRPASDADLQTRLPVFPKQQALPASFVKHLQAEKENFPFSRCLETGSDCAFWVGDLNNDGQDEVLLFNIKQGGLSSLLTQSSGNWREVGSLSSRTVEERFDNANLEGAQISRPEWSELVIDGKRYQVQLNPTLN